MHSMKSDSRIETLLSRIRAMDLGEIKLMEVCGTHTMSIAKSGIKKLLPNNIRLVSGPGCPVCVTPAGAMDAILHLSENKNIIIASYGDMLRVPGTKPGDSLMRRRAEGARVEIVYSPMDALAIAQKNPDAQVVFIGAGFETTAPGTAATIRSAKQAGVGNFSVLSLLKRVEPALRSLLSDAKLNVQGLLCPGHVASIVGERGFEFLPQEFGMCAVISGFEPEDILASIYRLLRQIEKKQPSLENTYGRAVSRTGNSLAMQMMEQVFIPRDDVWRGLGMIPSSGLGLRSAYQDFDAQLRFGIEFSDKEAELPCRCGDIICGRLSPLACPMFGRGCVPENPVGPCMVSSEGACAAAYKYGEV